MKRLNFLVTILLIVVLFSACGGEAELPEASTVPVPTVNYSVEEDSEDEQEDIFRKKIGFSLAGEGAFYDQLAIDIEKECASLNYEPHIITADSAKKQEQDIKAMLSTGVSVIIIDPVDVDLLEGVLAECETQSVPVINIIDSINGLVSTLISPDYLSIGKSAGQRAVDLLGELGGGCMMLKTDYDSFTMQLLSDGFNSVIDEDEKVSLVSEQFCGDDEETAYILTKSELLSANKKIDFIFAHSSRMALGALRAIDETSKDVKVVVFGGDMEIIEAVNSGDVAAAIFFGPGELAANAVYYANKFAKDETYQPPQYKELIVQTAEIDTIEEYLASGEIHAEIIGQ